MEYTEEFPKKKIIKEIFSNSLLSFQCELLLQRSSQQRHIVSAIGFSNHNFEKDKIESFTNQDFRLNEMV